MQTIHVITKADVERIVALSVSRKVCAIAKQLMHELEQRVPDPGPKLLRDDESIDLLGLSVRAYNVLSTAEVTTIGQLAALNRVHLSKLRNCGQLTILEIETRLARYGRRLAEYIP